MNPLKMILRFSIILLLFSSAIYASKGEAVSSVGVISSLKINLNLDPGYSDWGASIDQNRFAILLSIDNNNQKVALENIEIFATLNGEPLQIEFNSSLLGNTDTNNDELVDGVDPDSEEQVLLLSGTLTENLVNADLIIKILQHNGVTSNKETTEVASVMFAKNDSEQFSFGEDQFSFAGWDMTTEELVNFAGSDNMLGILQHAILTFQGQCFGMAGAAGNYFVSPESRPYSQLEPFAWPKNSVLEEEISAYNIAQIFPNLSNTFSNALPNQEIYKLAGYLEESQPAVITMMKEGENSGHSVLATKITILDRSDLAAIGCYDNREYNTDEVLASYKYNSKVFNYNDEYNKFRVDELPDASAIVDNGHFGVFKTKVSDFLYDTGQKLFTTASPVDMYVEDSQGRKTGLLEDGSPVNDIPDAEFYRVQRSETMGDFLTLIYVPQDDLYEVVMNCSENGLLRFEAYTPQEDDFLQFSYLDSLSVTDLWTITFSEEDGSGLKVDNDGDGSVEFILSMYSEDIPTDIVFEQPAAVVTGYELYQNYPNPFNPTTTITYAIPEAAHVTIRVYDIQGSYINTLSNNLSSAGTHRVIWDGTNSNGARVNSGVYFYELQTGMTRLVKKMQLLK